MHPMWAVRRKTHAELQKLPRERATENGFTCGIELREYSVVTVGSYISSSVATTIFVRVPFLTNSKDLSNGHELLWERLAAQPKKLAATVSYKEQAQKRQREKDSENAIAKKFNGGKNTQEKKSASSVKKTLDL